MTTAKKHVVVIGVEPASLLNFRKDLLCELVADGHSVTAVAMNPTEEQISSLQNLGVRVRSITFARAGMNPISDLKSMLHMQKLFVELKPDLVVGYTAKPVIFGALAARLAAVPQFCAMITGLGYSFIAGAGLKRRIARFAAVFLYRLALKRVSSIIFQNPDDLETFDNLQLLPAHIPTGIVNGSGVDLQYFKKCPIPNKPVFLMIARLLADKGIREYADAALKLRHAHPHVRTLLVGGLDPSPNSVSQIELNSWIAEGLEYFGQVDDVRPIISLASIIVLPSYREGTPRSVLEGMAMGRAIITTDAPGCRETVQHNLTGLLVPPRNTPALLNAMESLTIDQRKTKKMAEASYRLAQLKYDGKSVAKSAIRLAGL
jgi:glycosyltransferase involved in cell wall biosynthesis